MSSIKTRCCNAASIHSQGLRPCPAGLQVLQCSACLLDVLVIYNEIIYTVEEFLLDYTKLPGSYWQEAIGPRDKAVHYVLSQLVYDPDFSKDEAVYDIPDSNDVIKLLWLDQRAIGFYTVKPQGPHTMESMTSDVGMPTLDTAFIVPHYRGRGQGLSMLSDLASTYPGTDIALSYPISSTMWHVLNKYLEQNMDMRRKVWLVKDDCSEGNKSLIWFRLKRGVLNQ